MAEKYTYKKTELLKAMKHVLKEYKKNEHQAHASTCHLCKQYNRSEADQNNSGRMSRGHECRLCPMHVFHRPNEHSWDFYSCMYRKCTPVDCDGERTEDSNELMAVVKLYEEAIATVQKMTSEQLNEPRAFSFLIKIDKLCAKEFCLV